MPLDNYEPGKLEDHLKKKIEILSEAETKKYLDDLSVAIESARKMESLKAGLETVITVIKPLIPLPI